MSKPKFSATKAGHTVTVSKPTVNPKPRPRLTAPGPEAPGVTPPKPVVVKPVDPYAGDPGLSSDQRNAYELVTSMFKQYGLETLGPQILKMVQSGYDSATIGTMLQETQEYKTRFAANEQRKAMGLSVLSPAEYIAQERGYRQVLESQGLPAGFYDQASDFTKWITDDVSINEVNERASTAASAVASSDPNYLRALRDMGLGQGDLVASILDRNRALPILQKVVKTSQIAAEAYRNNLTMDQARAGYFAGLGVTQDAARQGYQTIGEILPTAEKLGAIYGQNFGQSDLEDELMGGSGLASQKRKALSNAEKSQFSGSSGGTKSTGRETKGSY